MRKWGIEVSDPEATFKKIDLNKGGSLLFDEFSHWILQDMIMPAEAAYNKVDIEFECTNAKPSILTTGYSLPYKTTLTPNRTPNSNPNSVHP